MEYGFIIMHDHVIPYLNMLWSWVREISISDGDPYLNMLWSWVREISISDGVSFYISAYARII